MRRSGARPAIPLCPAAVRTAGLARLRWGEEGPGGVRRGVRHFKCAGSSASRRRARGGTAGALRRCVRPGLSRAVGERPGGRGARGRSGAAVRGGRHFVAVPEPAEGRAPPRCRVAERGARAARPGPAAPPSGVFCPRSVCAGAGAGLPAVALETRVPRLSTGAGQPARHGEVWLCLRLLGFFHFKLSRPPL